MEPEEPSSKEALVFADGKIHDVLICSIHKGVLKNPLIIRCGHTYCESCLESLPKSQKGHFACPVDQKKTKMKDAFPNLALQDQIATLLVLCRHGCMAVNGQWVKDPNGCPEVIPLGSRDQHESECGWERVNCPNSTACERLRRMDLKAHLEICQRVPCKYKPYGCKFEGARDDVTIHLSACSYAQVSGYLEKNESRLHAVVSLIQEDAEKRSSVRKDMVEMENQLDLLEQDMAVSSKKLCERLDSLSANLETTQSQIAELLTALNPQRRRSNQFKQVVAPVAPAEIPEGGLRCTGTFSGHRGPVWCLAVSREHGVLVSGSSDLNLKIWDLASSKCKATLQGHVGIVHVLQLMGNRIFSGSADKTIRVWDLMEHKELKTLDSQENTVCALAIGGGFLFSGSYNTIRVWDIATYEFVRKIEGHQHWVRGMTVAHGCLWTGAYNTIKSWPLETFQPDKTFSDQEGSLYAVAVTADYVIGSSFYRRSTDVISRGNYENVIKVWSWKTNAEVACLGGHLGPIYALQVDAQRLFSGSYDSTIKVWSLRSFTCIQTLLRHTGSVECLLSHGTSLFSGSGDGTIKIWTP